jgi:hypothetical protein
MMSCVRDLRRSPRITAVAKKSRAIENMTTKLSRFESPASRAKSWE